MDTETVGLLFLALAAGCFLVYFMIKRDVEADDNSTSISRGYNMTEDEHVALLAPSQGQVLTSDLAMQFPPSVALTPSISVKTDAHAFLQWRASHIANQIVHINAQYAKEFAIRQAEFAHAHSDERIVQAYLLNRHDENLCSYKRPQRPSWLCQYRCQEFGNFRRHRYWTNSNRCTFRTNCPARRRSILERH